MGAEVCYKKDNAGVIQVNGRAGLFSGRVQIIPDRIASCTYLLAGVITNGEVTVTDVQPQHFDSLLAKLEEADVSYECQENSVTVYPSRGRLKKLSVKTMPYPGFPTDVQPQLMAASVQGTDLRAGAALVLAGLAAEGETRVYGLHHILRGYENFDRALQGLGAKVSVAEEDESSL